jgi:adenine-specific DNA-methyltransferase
MFGSSADMRKMLMSNSFDQSHNISGSSPNFRDALVAQLADSWPEVVADGIVDFEKLRELLGTDATDDRERYGLFWPGKRRALSISQEQTSATLISDPENSVNWDTTNNVFIEGDNLEVLKILQKHYHGKIKMIYIDPPYNTGKDFVYPDNFREGLANYLEWSRQVNEEGKKVSTNSETEGRYHSNWLNMMYPRLKLSRNLLTEDGVIFISIDDSEVDNLIKLCNEIFGEQNHIATFIWKSKSGGANDSGEVAVDHEYIVSYARRKASDILMLDPNSVASTSYNNQDEHGRYALERLDKQNLQYSKSMDFDLVGPDGTIYKLEHKDANSPNAIWRWSKDKIAKEMDKLVFKDGKVYTKNYEKQGGKARSLLVDERFGRTRTGSTEVSQLLGGDYFDNPKPTKLLKTLISIGTKSDSIVLDFFAGSGSTVHAVMDLNQQDGGTRRFIGVQLPEPTDENSDARKAGYATISAISRERIRRAGLQLEGTQESTLASSETEMDFGFRAYKLSESGFSKWRVQSDIAQNELEQHLLDLRDSAKDSASQNDLLVELLLKQGYSLSEKISTVEIDGMKLLQVADGLIFAYLDQNHKPSTSALREVLSRKPERLIILEDSFQSDDELKTNILQECKAQNVDLWTA